MLSNVKCTYPIFLMLYNLANDNLMKTYIESLIQFGSLQFDQVQITDIPEPDHLLPDRSFNIQHLKRNHIGLIGIVALYIWG